MVVSSGSRISSPRRIRSTKRRASLGALFELADRASGHHRARLDGVGSILDVPRRGPGVVFATQLLFVAPALLLEVDPHEARGELREKPRRADDAGQVGDREGDRDAVGHRQPVGLGQPEPGDGVARRSDGRGLGERAGDHARRRSRVVAENEADRVGHQQSSGGDDRRQRRLRQSVALEPTEELRPGPKPDREQEQQEEGLLDLPRHLHAELTDHHSGQERAGHGAEREAPQLDLAEQVADPEHEKERDLGMLAQNAVKASTSPPLLLRRRRTLTRPGRRSVPFRAGRTPARIRNAVAEHRAPRRAHPPAGRRCRGRGSSVEIGEQLGAGQVDSRHRAEEQDDQPNRVRARAGALEHAFAHVVRVEVHQRGLAADHDHAGQKLGLGRAREIGEMGGARNAGQLDDAGERPGG